MLTMDIFAVNKRIEAGAGVVTMRRVQIPCGNPNANRARHLQRLGVMNSQHTSGKIVHLQYL